MFNMTMVRRAALVAAVLIGSVATAQAQYPERGITIVVPYPPGGSTDVAARLVADRLADRLGTSVIVDNRPGAAGVVGAAVVAHADPDGYTFLITGSALASLPATDNPAFDLENDLDPVTRFAEGALIIFAGVDAPYDTIEEFIAYAKANPGVANGGMPGSLGAAHLAFERFRMEAGFEYMPIFYPGNAPTLAAVVGGEVEFGADSAPSARSFIEAGQMVGLAVTSATRFSLLPDVPTLGETVLPGYADGYSNNVFAPAGTPKDIIDLVAAEVGEIVQEPEIIAKFEEYGLAPITSTPEEFAAAFKEDIERAKLIVGTLRERGLLQ